MLTEEQIKNLKKGDIICMHVPFDSLTEEKFRFKTPTFPDDYYLPPKHDPNRRFKKGDRVRVLKEINGRPLPAYGKIAPGEFYTVNDDEESGNVMLSVCGKCDCIDWYWLELVTPVEESDLYYVVDTPHAFSICKHGGSKFAATFYKDHPLAREHAEKCCAALNDEHRKETK